MNFASRGRVRSYVGAHLGAIGWECGKFGRGRVRSYGANSRWHTIARRTIAARSGSALGRHRQVDGEGRAFIHFAGDIDAASVPADNGVRH